MSEHSPCPCCAVHQLVASDDSCQQQLYVRGHIDVDAFVSLVKKSVPFAEVRPGFVRHAWLSLRPVGDTRVCDRHAMFSHVERVGAEPVTVLDDWLPLWRHQTYHGRHMDHVPPSQIAS